jgi:hypothetical protein
MLKSKDYRLPLKEVLSQAKEVKLDENQRRLHCNNK